MSDAVIVSLVLGFIFKLLFKIDDLYYRFSSVTNKEKIGALIFIIVPFFTAIIFYIIPFILSPWIRL